MMYLLMATDRCFSLSFRIFLKTQLTMPAKTVQLMSPSFMKMKNITIFPSPTMVSEFLKNILAGYSNAFTELIQEDRENREERAWACQS